MINEFPIISLPPIRSVTNYNVAVMYNASDPASLASGANGEPIPASGLYRLWQKDGGEIRNPKSIRQGGDFVQTTTTPFPATELGFSETVRTKVFYLLIFVK